MRTRLLPVLVAFFLLFAGACSDDSGSSTGAGSESAATTTVAASVDPAMVADIQAELEGWMAEGAPPVPGASLTILLPDGQQITTSAGVSDLKTGTPVETTDYFRIGSVSKTITTAVMLQLVAEGEVSLDEPVATYLGADWIPPYVLDGVDYRGDVKVRDILSHTDGFKEFAWDPGFYLQTADRLDTPYEPQELLDWGAAQGPMFPPGTDYSYNTVGHVAAGLIIEKVTGNSVNDEFERRIFEPLGLENIFLPPGTNPPQPVVHGYAVGELLAGLQALPQVEQYKAAGIVGDDEYFDMMSLPQEAISTAGWTAGGFEAQLSDVAAIFRAMFDGTLLDEDSVTSFITPNAFSDYALGLEVDDTLGYVTYEHGGGVPGFRTYAAYYPELDIAIAISVNAVPVDPDVDDLAERLLKIVTSNTPGPHQTTDGTDSDPNDGTDG